MRATQNSNFNKGFTYIGLLLFIAITGVGLSMAGMSWQYQVRAEKEKQLLFVGAEFRNAINSYYASTPDAAKVYPVSLNDLLLDKRIQNIKRHLRKIYLDPMTGKANWGIVTQQGRIVGIYSRSTLVPYKQKGFNVADAKLTGPKSYREWIFGINSLETSSLDSKKIADSNAENSNSMDQSGSFDNQNDASNPKGSNEEMQNTSSRPNNLSDLEYWFKYGID